MKKLFLALAFCAALIGSASSQMTMTGVGGGSSAGGFSPSSLSPSWWIEARSSSLFQSNVGSGTPAASSTDPVGSVSDLSANAFTISSVADDTTRPTLQGVGSFPYLACDGSNDMLRRTAALDGWNAGSTTWVFAFRSNSNAISTYVAANGNSADTDPIFSLLKATTTATTSGGFYRDDAGTTPPSAPNATTPPNTNVFDGNDHVMIIVDTGTAINVWKDGAPATGIASYTHSGTLTLNRFSVCAQLRTVATGAAFWAGRIYGALIINGYAASGADITNLNTYFTALYQ